MTGGRLPERPYSPARTVRLPKREETADRQEKENTMKKFLVVALIEGADIDGDTPEVVQADLKDLIEHDFSDSAEVHVVTLPTDEGDDPQKDYGLVTQLADKLKVGLRAV